MSTLTEEQLPAVRPCASGLSHIGMPAWLDPSAQDWKKQAARVGVQELLERQRTYLRGFTDCRGNHWCGQCYWRCRLIDLGDQLGYPALDLVQLAAGYDAWLQRAKEGGVVAVEDSVRSAERLLRSRGTPLNGVTGAMLADKCCPVDGV